ncbi:MAG: M23 family metallopeptidase, partial [Sedimentitalea sp.]|nr:M23 family metallopeptidase [Sedimentitalea sp.]
PQAGPEPVRHKVARGETAYTIARLYSVPVKALGEWNGLGPDFAIREGQYLLIPVAGAAPPASAAAVTQPGAGSPTPTPPSAATPLPDQKIAATPPEPPKVSVGEPTRASGGGAMALPVQGTIIRAYAKGRNDGIDISAAPGTPVTAAAAGTVAAITADADKVPIIVIRHPDNLLTVYANVENITVKKGDSVSRGQKLASLRGGDNAYVHFEVRDGFDSVDPSPYLQ